MTIAASQPVVAVVKAVAPPGIPLLPSDASWLSIAQAAVPTLVACAVAYIAIRQWLTARAKLKFDLFERRQKIYDSAMYYIDLIFLERVDRDAWETFQDTIGTSEWLFKKPVVDHLKNIETLNGKLAQANTSLRKLKGTPQEELAALHVERAIAAIHAQYQRRFEVFGDYLRLGH